MENLLFDSWESIGRIIFIGVFSYTGLILILRTSGNRTLSQLNAFDFVVTVALGSILGTVILNKSVALIDGLTGLGLLVLLQMVVSRLSVWSKTIRRIVKSEPVLILFQGNFIQSALQSKRITEDEVLQMLRSNGIADKEGADAIVLETNGNFSVIKKSGDGETGTALQNVAGIKAAQKDQ